MTEKQLKEIEAQYEAATPGCRKVINVNAGDPMEYGPFWVVTNDALDAEQDWDVEIRFGGEADAVFDAEIYNALPELVAEVRHLRAEQVFVRSMLAEVEEGALTPSQFHTRLARATQEEIAALYAVVRRAEQKGVQDK